MKWRGSSKRTKEKNRLRFSGIFQRFAALKYQTEETYFRSLLLTHNFAIGKVFWYFVDPLLGDTQKVVVTSSTYSFYRKDQIHYEAEISSKLTLKQSLAIHLEETRKTQKCRNTLYEKTDLGYRHKIVEPLPNWRDEILERLYVI